MESISYYGGNNSEDEQENSNNAKQRDNSTRSHYGNAEFSTHAFAHSSLDTGLSRRRKATDDTNYEEIQMDLSEDSNSSDNHGTQTKVDEPKPKKHETDFALQSSHRSDKYNRSDDKPKRSSSKEHDRYKGDKYKDISGRERFSDKERDKIADRHRNREKDRERDRDREHERDRNNRLSKDKDRSRNRPEKDDKYSRHRDNRSDRRDRNERYDRIDRKRDRKIGDNRSYERDRNKRHGTRSKTKSRSRSRDRSSNHHDKNAIKEPPKSLMSLQLPPMSSATSTILAARPTEPVTGSSKIISPLLTSARYTEQMQKRKLLWGNKKAEGEQQTTTNNRWEQTKFSQDSDGKMASKFLRLMGMKDAPKVGEDETQKAPDSIKKQNEMLSSMEQQYEVVRQVTHTMRGMGLGFGTQPRHY